MTNVLFTSLRRYQKFKVFRVKSKNDGKYYAVKRTIEPFRNSRDREMKLREVQKHELLPKHPNLVEFKCAWEEKGQLYIQTELCEYRLLFLFFFISFGVLCEPF